MAADGEKLLIIDKLNKLADLMRDLRELTANLLSVCSLEQPDSFELAALLCRRQQLIAAAAKIDPAATTQTAVSRMEGEEDLAIEKKLGEIRRLFEETGVFDRKTRIMLEAKREQIKMELAGLRAGRAAGKAYHAQAPQAEGFFLDSREN